MSDVKLYASLKTGIQGLFRRFTEDLVQQKKPKLKDSSGFSAELLDVLRTDYIKQKQVSRSVAHHGVVESLVNVTRVTLDR